MALIPLLAALDIPFLLLPFRPSSDPSAARTFVRNYFLPQTDREALRGTALANEVKMTDVMVQHTLRHVRNPADTFHRSWPAL